MAQAKETKSSEHKQNQGNTNKDRRQQQEEKNNSNTNHTSHPVTTAHPGPLHQSLLLYGRVKPGHELPTRRTGKVEERPAILQAQPALQRAAHLAVSAANERSLGDGASRGRDVTQLLEERLGRSTEQSIRLYPERHEVILTGVFAKPPPLRDFRLFGLRSRVSSADARVVDVFRLRRVRDNRVNDADRAGGQHDHNVAAALGGDSMVAQVPVRRFHARRTVK
jgi:hypothetical protein